MDNSTAKPATDLRTRIAVALREVDDMRVCKLSDADIKFLADAVIREINLAKACQSGCVWQIPNHVEDMTPQQQELLKRDNDD